MSINKKPVEDFGINDVDYVVSKFEYIEDFTKGGNRKKVQVWECPYYTKWSGMLTRAYSADYHKRRPTYIGCSVSEDFKYLSDFIKWLDSQPDKDWKNKQLDKDFLIEGNKHYSPETCVLLGVKVNSFINEGGRTADNTYLIGAQLSGSKVNPFMAYCSDPFGRYKRYIGMYKTELEAHLAWKDRKHKYACELAELEPDPRVKEILINKYK